MVIRYKSVSPLPHLVSYTRTVSRPCENTRADAACPDWQRISGTRRRCGRRAFRARCCSMPGTILPLPPPPPPARGESPGPPGSGHPQSPRCCCPTRSDAANIWKIVSMRNWTIVRISAFTCVVGNGFAYGSLSGAWCSRCTLGWLFWYYISWYLSWKDLLFTTSTIIIFYSSKVIKRTSNVFSQNTVYPDLLTKNTDPQPL